MQATHFLVLIGILVWFGATIVPIENKRYALELGMCSDFEALEFIERQACFDSVETRSNWVWHHYYALVQR
jgi:hypothetical protein